MLSLYNSMLSTRRFVWLREFTNPRTEFTNPRTAHRAPVAPTPAIAHHPPNQNPAIEGESIVHKEIRFKVGGCCHWPHCPSTNYSFLRNPVLTDDWIVMGKGSKMEFAFTGGYCTPWRKDECERYSILLSNLLECKARNSVKRKR